MSTRNFGPVRASWHAPARCDFPDHPGAAATTPVHVGGEGLFRTVSWLLPESLFVTVEIDNTACRHG